MTDVSSGLAKELYTLCLEIEKLSASEQQTTCSIMASNLLHKWGNAMPVAEIARPTRERDLERQRWVISDDGHAKALRRAEAAEERVRALEKALARIRDAGADSHCGCECGDDPDCCLKVGATCDHCLAQATLQAESLLHPKEAEKC